MAEIITREHGIETLERHRDHDWTLRLYQSDEAPAGLAADDVVRFKVWQTADADPAIDCDSGDAAPDSHVVIVDRGENDVTAAEVTVKLMRADVNDLAAGEWNWEASVVVPSDDDRIFVFARGAFDVQANATGDLGPF